MEAAVLMAEVGSKCRACWVRKDDWSEVKSGSAHEKDRK